MVSGTVGCRRSIVGASCFAKVGGMDGVHLVYQYFHVQPTASIDPKPIQQRQAEYDHCLIANLVHDHVSGVHVLLETETELRATRAMLQRLEQEQRPWLSLLAKFHPLVLGHRLRYSDAMQYANDKLPGKLVVILNADIYLGGGVDPLLQRRYLLEPRTTGPTTVLSLTRHEHGICKEAAGRPKSNTSSGDQEWCGCPFMKGGKYFGSHDSFWFVAPLNDRVVEGCRHVHGERSISDPRATPGRISCRQSIPDSVYLPSPCHGYPSMAARTGRERNPGRSPRS